tara:strand:- start:11696 stop:12193 length:498 start_codon:yes stop_codon:yes gene_type:complete
MPIKKIKTSDGYNNSDGVVSVNKFGSTQRVDVNVLSTVSELNYATWSSGDYNSRFNDYGLRRTTVEIGDWNMDSTGFVKVNHGLDYSDTWKGTRSTAFTIRNDADTVYFGDNHSKSGTHMTNIDVAVSGITSKKVVLIRKASGSFDSADFDSTSYNRGWVTVWYE